MCTPEMPAQIHSRLANYMSRQRGEDLGGMPWRASVQKQSLQDGDEALNQADLIIANDLAFVVAGVRRKRSFGQPLRANQLRVPQHLVQIVVPGMHFVEQPQRLWYVH